MFPACSLHLRKQSLSSARPACLRLVLTNIVKAPRCQAFRQTGCKKEACEKGTEEVVGMAGAQFVLLTAVGSAPTQSQLLKKRELPGSVFRRNGVHQGSGRGRDEVVGTGACAWSASRELRLETEGHLRRGRVPLPCRTTGGCQTRRGRQRRQCGEPC